MFIHNASLLLVPAAQEMNNLQRKDLPNMSALFQQNLAEHSES